MGYGDVVLNDSPLARWRFTETSGPWMSQGTKASIPMSVMGTPTLAAPGLVADGDPAVNCKGTGGGRVDQASATFALSTMSIECLFTATSFPGIVALNNQDDGASARHHQFRLNGSNLELITFVSNTSPVTMSTPVTTNTTYHAVATITPTAAAIWLNGVQAVTKTVTAQTSYPSGVQMDVGVPSPAIAGGLYWPGVIDEMALYDKALTQAQIQAHYNAVGSTTPSTMTSPPGVTPTATPFVGWGLPI